MPSPSSHPSRRPSRRTVLATGSALGGTLLAGGLPAQASAAASEDAPADPLSGFPSDPWRTVLDDADLVWQQMPKTWYEGPYLGNGFLGSGIYAEPGTEADTVKAIRFNVQHSEVQDHRPQFGSLFGLARLPIGYFTLEPVGAITGLDWRLGLRDAELTGTLTTDRGTLTIRALVHTSRSVLAGVTRWVRLVSEAGAPCVVRHGIAGAIEVRDGRGRPLRYEDAGDGAIQVALKKGESALITAKGDRPDLRIAPVEPNEPAPRWGLPTP